MEAFSISPVTASHQTAKPQGTPQGPRGLGDIFAALLLEAASRLDARLADLASFETRRSSGEPPRKTSAAAIISSGDSKDWRNDVGFHAHGVANDAEAARDRIESIAPTEAYAEATDDSEFAAPAPEDDANPSAAAGDATPESNEDEIQLAEGEDAEVPAPAAQDEDAPVAEEIAAPVALPTQAQSTASAWARATTQSGVPAHAAQQAQAVNNIGPAAAGQLGAEVGATRVQITPAAVVAQPNAALGGGAAVAALAAEAGQAAAQNAAQNGAQNSQASLPNAASETAATAATAAGLAALQPAKPGTRTGLNGPVADGPAPARDAASSARSATIAQNGSGLTHATQSAVTAVEAAPAAGLQGQSQGAPVQGATSPTAGEPGSPNPQNAQTAFAESNNQHAGNSGTPGSLSAAASAAEAGIQNRLGQNARADTAQSLGAPVPGADAAASVQGGQQPGASRAATETTQGARPAALEGNQNHAAQNNTAQTARAEGPAQIGVAAQAAAQNAPSGTAAAAGRAMAPTSVQRAEGAGQANAHNPTAAGMPGLTLAAARTPQTLPAQARPATAASLPANQVAVHIQRAVAAGQGRIRITLHPAELGQIDVKLNIGNDGVVKAIVSIERPETFELLQRDARGLEKALQDAGLKTDSGSLSFNLKGQSEQDRAAAREGAETGSHDGESDAPAEPELAPDMIAAAHATGAERVLDLHV